MGAWAVTLGALAAVAAGCGEEASPVEVTSCERTSFAANRAPGPAVDVVVVVSDGASMAAHRGPLIAHLAALGDAADALGHGPQLHLAVVGDDGGGFATAPQIEGCVPPDGEFASSIEQPWFQCVGDDGCRVRNFTDSLDRVVPCLGAVPAAADAAPALLDRLDRALGDDNPAAAAFLRPDAALVVIVIAADDDASTASPDDVAARLAATRADPARVYVAVVGPAEAPRLASFAGAFDKAIASRITDSEWRAPVDALEWTAISNLVLDGCLLDEDVLDLDIATPGLQHDCVSTEVDWATGAEGAVIRPCELEAPGRPSATNPLPCFHIREPLDWERSAGCAHIAVIERAQWPAEHGAVHCACEP